MQDKKAPPPEQVRRVEKIRRKHHARIINHLRQLLYRAPISEDRRQVAEDLAQNVYVNLLQYNICPEFRDEEAYCIGLANHEFVRYLHRRKKDPMAQSDGIDEPMLQKCPELRTAEEDLYVARLNAFEPALDRLSPEEQQIISMNMDQISAAKMAKPLGKSYSVARLALTKARKALQDHIDDVIHGRVRK